MEVAGSMTWAALEDAVVDAAGAVEDAAGCVVVVWEDIFYLFSNIKKIAIYLYYQYIKFYINYCV